MSPLVKALLATALTLPLVAFVAGVLASPDPVDPDRSRPVIIGRVNDDQPLDKPTPSPSRKDEQPTKGPRDPGGDDDDGGGEESPDEPDGGGSDDQPYTVVTPPPRDLDGDDDDGDDDDDDDSDDREGSGDD